MSGNAENDGKYWCSVEIDDSGHHVRTKWGYCESACQPDGCLTDKDKCIGSKSLDDGKIKSP